MRRTRARQSSRRLVVLIIEDDDDALAIYSTGLAAHGFDVRTASDGLTGFDLAVRAHPDVIVMDLSLPGLDGWEATRRLKGDVRTADVPILACTAHALGPAVERALEVGCDAYLVKPCLPTDVRREVEALLARTRRRLRA